MHSNLNWLVFAMAVARAPSSERVALWRALRARGAIPLAGVYVLPARAECEAFFEALGARVRARGGAAHMLRVNGISGLDDAKLIGRFHAERGARYEALARDLARRSRRVTRRLLAGARRRFDDIVAHDYFDTPTRKQAERALAAAERTLRADAPVTTREAPDLRGKRWVTAPRPGPDALACAWLIRRFVDASAMIHYRLRARADETPFAMTGAYFEARDGQTAFDLLCDALGLRGAGIGAMRKLVRALEQLGAHRAVPEAHGVAAALRGWRLTQSLTDAALEARSRALFDGAYTSYNTPSGKV